MKMVNERDVSVIDYPTIKISTKFQEVFREI